LSPEEDWVYRAQAGDREAFANLVRLLEGELIHFAFRLQADRNRAEDLAQEAFVEAFRRLSFLRDPKQVRPWIRGIVRNLHRARRRQESREPALIDLTDLELASSTCESQETDLFAGLEPAELFARVAAEIERLPDPYRTTLILRHYERLPCRVIAKRLGIPIGTVTMRLSRGHRMLREAIARPTVPAWRT